MASRPGNPSPLTPEQQALVALRRMKSRIEELEAAERRRAEPIAVVGIGCRFPGGEAGPLDFWRFLLGGGDGIREVPPDRWDVDALYDPDPRAPGKMTTRWGGFLSDVRRFDARFFGVSAREAAAMDPQQRLLLEVAWEAFEDAGLARERTAGSRTGVFVGVSGLDYVNLQIGDLARIDGYTGSGIAHSMVPNRLSYLLDLRGPSVAIDTACSSSLVALHLACQSLRAGECDLALAGGVNLILAPETTVSFSKFGMMAADGRCKTFDAAADGFVRGEGCGLVVLERLGDARRHLDRVDGIVRGSSVNQDGRTNGLTAPNRLSQEVVIRQALAAAGIEPGEVDAIEAHGTGTSLGDPIEVEALSSVFGSRRADGRPYVLASVKTNVGHLESAAGVAGLVRILLALRHGVHPPHLHFRAANPGLFLESGPFVVPTAPLDWPSAGRPRRAGVSSFGFGGTNAHVVVEEPPAEPATDAGVPAGAAVVLPLSAHGAESLAGQAERMRQFLLAGGADPRLVAATAALRRTHHPRRAAVVGATAEELARRLEELPTAAAAPSAGRRIFVFSGQGTHHAGMAVSLLEREPAARASIEAFDRAMVRHASWTVAEAIRAGDRWEDTEFAQPALVAIHLAVVAVLSAWGIEPDAVIGHSLGEVSAAVAAGAIPLEDAVLLAVRRGRILQRTKGRGAMIAFEAAPGELAAVPGVSVAALNGPRDTVLAGDREALAGLAREFEGRGGRWRWVSETYAFHGPGLEAAAEELRAGLQGLSPAAGRVPIASSTLGALAGGASLDPAHWAANLARPVHFAAAVEAVSGAGAGDWIEIGPRPVLGGAIRRTLESLGRTGAVHATLRRGRDDRAALLEVPAALWSAGHEIDWTRLYRPVPPVRLPPYAWAGEAHWIDPILRSPASLAADVYEVRWSPAELPPAGAVASGTWLVSGERSRGEAFARELERAGQRAILATGGEIPAGIDGVLFAPGAEVRPAILEALDLVRRIATAPEPRPRLWIATAGAAALRGLGRVLALEHPDFWGGLVDLERAGELALPASALLGHDAEDQFARRGGEWFVPRLAPLRLPAGPPLALSPEGTWLVTGGLGGLGRRIAAWLVDRGARRLVLTTRSRDGRDAVEALERAGARVRIARVDAGDRAGTIRLLEEIGPSLAGVVHAAGVLERGPAAAATADGLEAAFRAKADGAVTLGELVPPGALLVLVGSAAATWGSRGMALYAAANAALGDVARDRRARGGRALAVHWGWVAGGGMASAAGEEALSRIGHTPLDPAAALGALERLLASDAVEATVANVDWTTFRPVYEARRRRPFLDDVAPAPRPSGPEPEAPPWPARLADAPAPGRRALLLELVRAEVAAVLGDLPERLDLDRGLQEQGLDSVMAIELKGRLERRSGAALGATHTFEHPTVRALADDLARRLDLAREGDRPPRSSPAPADPGEPIAVVGAGCRFPGGANDLDSYWRVLVEGVDAIRPGAPERGLTRPGGYLDDVDRFDAAFFDIPPREAIHVDPQHRLVLQVAWEALEDAGIDPSSLAGSDSGVFVGITATEYGRGAEPDPYQLTGLAHGFAAGRLSYVLGLEGPSLAVDTACSSALVAIHLACASLRRGECRLALAGGVNLILDPGGSAVVERFGMLAPDGRCKTFDRRADGFVRGEGCGIAVLKTLSAALADGDRILALVRGTAVNQDGATGGLTVPSPRAQQRVIEGALAEAGVRPAEVGYVEAHGTGTSLGDPIELGALGAVLGRGREPGRAFAVGSVKTNLGHLESAAGIAGFLKAVLALSREVVPPPLHLVEPSPHVPWAELPAVVPARPTPWPRAAERRVAGVSAFGASGTNAHVVLEEAPATAAEASSPRSCHLFTLSARTGSALRELARRSAERLDGALAPASVARTLNAGRARFRHRLAIVASSVDELRRALETGEGRVAGEPPRVAFLFAGQGGQRAGAGRELYATEPVFREWIDRASARLDRPLRDVLLGEPGTEGLLDRTEWTQPALYAFEYALAELWRSWGIEPAAVLGHSIGEVVAAAVAGVFSFEDGLVFAAERGRLMGDLPAGGAMAAVAADAARVRLALREGVAVAAVNAPDEVVLSGDERALLAVLAGLGVPSRRLEVSHAFHSPLLAAALPGLEEAARRAGPGEPRIGLVSNVTGTWADAGLLGRPEYWWRQAASPVLFQRSLETLLAGGFRVFLEIGPRATLSAIGKRVPGGDGARWIPSLAAGPSETRAILGALAELWLEGADLDGHGLHRFDPPARARVPTYPFEGERFWLTPRARPSPGRRSPIHPLLERRIRTPISTVLYESTFGAESPALLDHHRIYGPVVVPASCYLSMVLAAARSALGPGTVVIENAAFPEALLLEDGDARTVQLALSPGQGGPGSFRLASAPADGEDSPWTTHAAGEVRIEGPPAFPAIDVGALAARLPEVLDGGFLYELARRGGLLLGEEFRWMEELRRGPGEALCRLRVGDGVEYGLHPGLLDSTFQALGFTQPDPDAAFEVRIPVGLDRLAWSGPAGGACWCWTSVERRATRAVGRIRLLDSVGATLLAVDGLVLLPAPRESLLAAVRRGPPFHHVEWRRVPDRRARAVAATPRPWIVAGDRSGIAPLLASELAARGRQVELAPTLESASRPPSAAFVLLGEPRELLGLVRRLPSVAEAWIVTTGATAAPPLAGSGLAVEDAASWGLARVFANEHPELPLRRVDLDPSGTPAGSARALAEEILAEEPEDELALRGSRRLVPRLVPGVPRGGAAREPFSASPEAAYLIAGGTGALGLAVARWLAEKGACRLVLAARREPAPDAAAVIARLEAGGCRVETRSVDIARRDEVEALVRSIDALGGVVHAAGVLDDAVLLATDEARLARALAPKLAGAVNLHAATADRPLDLFVLFASLAGIAGWPGQGSYAAANAALDALAHHRRALGLPAIAIDWGPWAGGGMARDLLERHGDRWAARGGGSLTPDEGLRALEEALRLDVPQLGVFPIDWRAAASSFPAGRAPAILAEVLRDRGSRPDAPAPGSLAREVEAAAPGERRRVLRSRVREEAAGILGYSRAAPLERARPLGELGFDSLMAVELRNRLGLAVGRSLPTTLLFDQPTLDAIAAYLADEVFRLEPEPGDPSPPPAASDLEAALEAVEGLDEAELDARLSELAGDLERDV